MQIDVTPEYLASQGLSSEFPERFWKKVIKTEGCWYWTAATVNGGYGTISVGPPHNEFIRAPRASYILSVGPIPEGLDILHHCDTPSCVRPDHLRCGTARDNMHDMIAKGRHGGGAKKGEAHFGRKLSEQEVLKIRELAQQGWSQRQLGRRFSVDRTNIACIVKRKSWTHI